MEGGSYRPAVETGADVIALWPRWLDDAGTMLRMKALVRCRCAKCGTLLRVELEDVVARHGAGYSLVDRLDRCRMVGCDGTAFYAASRFSLNVTRADMIEAGWSPSVRLFEAALCACPVISDVWEGLDLLFVPGREILLARTTEDVIAALEGIAPAQARAIGEAARTRALAAHTAAVRAEELERHLEETMVGKAAAALTTGSAWETER